MICIQALNLYCTNFHTCVRCSKVTRLLKTALLIVVFWQCILWQCSTNLYAQSSSSIINQVDSLLKKLPELTQPQQKLGIHLQLAKIILNGHQSLKYAQQALTLATELGDKAKMAQAYIEIGNDCSRINEYTQAAQAIFAAANLYKSVGNDRGYGVALNMLGQLYFSQSDYTKAITYFSKAITLHTTRKDSIQLADDYNNLGEVYRVKGSTDTALSYFTQAQTIYQQQNSKPGMAYSLGNIGLVLAATGQQSQAEANLTKASQILQELNDVYPIAIFNIEMAKISLAAGDIKIATQRALAGYTLARKEGLKEQVRDAAWVLFQIGKDNPERVSALQSPALPKQETAIDYLQIYYAYKDSLLNEQTIRKIADLQTNYQVSQKEEQVGQLTLESKYNRTIAIFLGCGLLLIGVLTFYLFGFTKQLKRANTTLYEQQQQLQQQNGLIEQSLVEKEILLKEIHHRVKNNLQIISSLLNLQSNSIADSELIEIFQTGQCRIQSIALIHQKLYQNDSFTVIQIQEYIEQLAHKIIDTLLSQDIEVSVNVDAQHILLDIDTAVPLGLIINELLTNSIKYAFSGTREGHISIQIVQTQEHGYQLLYADSGQGLPQGIRLECASTLGSKLITILTRQLAGQLEYFNEHGARFIIRFYDTAKRTEPVSH